MRRSCLLLATVIALALSPGAGSSSSAQAPPPPAPGSKAAACVNSAIHRSLIRASSRYVKPTRWTISARVRAVKRGCGGRRTIVAYPEVNRRPAVPKRKIARWKTTGPKRILRRFRITRKVCKRDESYVRGVVELTYVLAGRSYGYRRYVATRNKPC